MTVVKEIGLVSSINLVSEDFFKGTTLTEFHLEGVRPKQQHNWKRFDKCDKNLEEHNCLRAEVKTLSPPQLLEVEDELIASSTLSRLKSS
jgi:hypothetical protein